MRPFSIIVAVDLELGIGKDGSLPWNLPEDMKHFKELTTQTKSPDKRNAVVMGRKTWESLPEKFRPLPERLNVVLTRNENCNFDKNVLKSPSLPKALDLLNEDPHHQSIESIFIIGGGEVFKQAVDREACQKIYLTQILAKFHSDVFFPKFDEYFVLTQQSLELQAPLFKYRFCEYSRKP